MNDHPLVLEEFVCEDSIPDKKFCVRDSDCQKDEKDWGYEKIQVDMDNMNQEFQDFKTKQNADIQDIKMELSRLTKFFNRVYGKRL